jgi:hypothetical protein
MNRHSIPILCFVLAGTAFAQGVYKWTDDQGKVHYGDGQRAPSNGTKTTIRGSVATDNGNVQRGEGQGAPSSVSKTAIRGLETSDTGNLQNCLAMARGMADKKNPSPAEIRADSKALLDLCPGTAYDCVTYIERPESNDCKAVPLTGPIMRNRTLAR